MKLQYNDLAIAAVALTGIISSFKDAQLPFYVYVILIVAYAGMRLAKVDMKEV